MAPTTHLKLYEIRRVKKTYQNVLQEFKNIEDLNIPELSATMSMLQTSIKGLQAVEDFHSRTEKN